MLRPHPFVTRLLLAAATIGSFAITPAHAAKTTECTTLKLCFCVNDDFKSLIDEMQTHDVRTPNQLLASPNTSLELVRGFLPPGVQKGDRIDVEVRVPIRSETASLRGGWLMQTRLRPMEQLGGEVRTGLIIALAEGPVLIDSAFSESDDKVLLTRGRVLGGGVSQTSRPLGLVIKKGNTSIATATLVGGAINSRFYYFDGSKKKGVANPKTDVFIELVLQPRYKSNVWRYMQVVKAIPLREAPVDRLARLQTLQLKLLEPTTAGEAAIHLEAIGKEAITTLKTGLASKDPEVRFHAAEALAYLDEADAAPVLGEAAQHTPAFRWAAIAALGTMDHINAYDALVNLLHISSAEARYGAFRAIRARNPRDPLVRGEVLADGKVSYHVVPTTGEPMIHFAKSQRPEIVLFGTDVRLAPPTYLEAGKSHDILVKGLDDEHIKVVRFVPGHDDLTEICSPELTQIIPAILKVGGDYTDVLQVMQQAKKKGFVTARIAIDALPQPGRIYERDDNEFSEPVHDEPIV